MNVIETGKAPAAIGSYSQGTATGGLVFVSGQLPANPKTGVLETGSVADQARQAISNIAAILEPAGTDLAHVVKTTCFLADLGDFEEFNAEYARHFTSNPARECVQVAKLPKGATLEVSAIADTSKRYLIHRLIISSVQATT